MAVVGADTEMDAEVYARMAVIHETLDFSRYDGWPGDHKALIEQFLKSVEGSKEIADVVSDVHRQLDIDPTGARSASWWDEKYTRRHVSIGYEPAVPKLERPSYSACLVQSNPAMGEEFWGCDQQTQTMIEETPIDIHAALIEYGRRKNEADSDGVICLRIYSPNWTTQDVGLYNINPHAATLAVVSDLGWQLVKDIRAGAIPSGTDFKIDDVINRVPEPRYNLLKL